MNDIIKTDDWICSNCKHWQEVNDRINYGDCDNFNKEKSSMIIISDTTIRYLTLAEHYCSEYEVI
jgi:hypothetical protein